MTNDETTQTLGAALQYFTTITAALQAALDVMAKGYDTDNAQIATLTAQVQALQPEQAVSDQ